MKKIKHGKEAEANMKLRRIAKKIVKAPERFFLKHKTRNQWPEAMRRRHAVYAYKKATGREIDLHNPVTFPEKIIWYKLFYKRKGLEKIVDKYQFKAYIEEKLGPGHTIPMFGAWDSAEAFRAAWPDLPEEFCLKSNLMSDGNGIRMIHHKSKEDLEDVCRFVEYCLNPKNTLINSYCYAYYKAKPMVIAEEYMSNVADQLFDYKIYCFQGEPYTICASAEHFSDECYPITYYDLEWNKMNVLSGKHRNDDIPAPIHLNEMIRYARELSADFPFVRVDFFDTDKKLYLAELTFYPGGGLFTYQPEEFNRTMGDLFVLPK